MHHRSPGFFAALRWGVYLSAGICAYAVLVQFALKPMHAREQGQEVFGFLNGLDRVLQAPGLKAGMYIGELHPAGHLPFRVWLFAVAFNALFYFSAGSLLECFWLWIRGDLAQSRVSRISRSKSDGNAEVQRLTRRGFLLCGMKLAGGGVLGGIGYSLVVEARWFEISRRTFPLPDLHPALDGLQIVHLTDIHHGPWLSRAYVRDVVETANGLKPDMFLLTGDYVHQSPAYIEPVVEELGKLRPKIGTLAVLGNHDWWEDAALFRREFGRVGIPLLDNTRCILTPERKLVPKGREGLAIAGVGDLWEDRLDYQAALADLPEHMPRLLLSHNPDVAEEQRFIRGGHRVDLMLSGHTHGGQIFIPFLGTPIIPSYYGQKYAQGLVQGPVCPVYVCRGLGMTVLPLRCGVKPEMAVIELRRA